MRVVVLGGSGFLGSAVAGLLRARHSVCTVGLPRSAVDVGADLIAEPQAVAPALRGADAVVYAIAASSRNRSALAGEMAGAAAAAGAQRWVHLSNVSVYRDGAEWVDDNTPAEPGSALGRDTLAMEQDVRHRLSGSALTFLRFGPAFAADGGYSGASTSYVQPGDNWLSHVCRDDVAAAVELALHGGLPQVCVVGDGAPLPAQVAARVVSDRRGRPVRPVARSTAQRFGETAFSVLTGSVRIRPAALYSAGWWPTVRLSEAQPAAGGGAAAPAEARRA